MPISLPPAVINIGRGDPDLALPGTGLSVPGGIESTFEFNGLLLNYRDWVDTYLVTEIDGLDDADVRDARENNPGFDGETPFDAYYGGRTIILSGKIRAFSLFKLRDMEQALRAAFGPLEESPLTIRSGVGRDVKINCRKSQKLTVREVQADTRYWRDFQISLRASDPTFLSRLEEYTPVSMPVSPAATTIFNKGNYPARPRFKIAGPITNPVLTNTTTGKQITIVGAIPAGEVWEIDTLHRTLRDGGGVNQFGKLSAISDWIELVPGDNVIQMTGAALAPGTNFQILWNHTWI